MVNDNTYTNVMARFNLGFAAWAAATVATSNPDAFQALVRSTGVTNDEIASWNRAADAMFIPYDAEFGIHPQDVNFLEREVWDFASTPADKYPLLLHFHPLVIYRHQVLKQADVVLAMFLRGKHFPEEQKRRNFDYYDPLTTGDSSLSACVQSIVAADVGYDDLAFDYFNQSLYLDLADTHGNTCDGVHVANAGGVWAAVVYGFAGMIDREGELGLMGFGLVPAAVARRVDQGHGTGRSLPGRDRFRGRDRSGRERQHRHRQAPPAGADPGPPPLVGSRRRHAHRGQGVLSSDDGLPQPGHDQVDIVPGHHQRG